jgi:hypothetical protein
MCLSREESAKILLTSSPSASSFIYFPPFLVFSHSFAFFIPFGTGFQTATLTSFSPGKASQDISMDRM